MRKAAEAIWKRITGSAMTLHCEQYVVGGNSLVAIVETSVPDPQSELGQAMTDFRYLCMQEWPGNDHWGTAWRIRALDTREKLREAEELIVQLMVNSQH